MNKLINITVGPDLSGKGGVVTVLKGFEDQHFFEKTGSILVPSTKKSSRFSILTQYLTFLVCLCRLVRYFAFSNVGLVHIHMASKGSYLRKSIIVRLACLFKVPVILHLHGAKFDEFYDKSSARLKAHIAKTFRMSTRVIVLSNGWKEWADKTFNIKAVIVYNSVPKINVVPQLKTAQIILFLGRLGQRKGVDDLLRAFALTVKLHPAAKLVLGGDGDIPYYQKLIADLNLTENVELAGWVSGDMKARLLSSATIFTLPSYAEGFPMGVLEAMSAGVTVIASTAGGIPDAIKHPDEGLLVTPGDITTLSKYFNEMLADPSKCAELAKAGNHKFVSNFSPEVILPNLEQIYADVIAGNKTAIEGRE